VDLSHCGDDLLDVGIRAEQDRMMQHHRPAMRPFGLCE
jgi:hypothetical protein